MGGSVDELFSTLEEERILVVRPPQDYEISLTDTRFVKQAIDTIKALEYQRCLVDCRSREFRSTATGPLARPEVFGAEDLDPRTKIAWVLDELTWDARHYENVLVNRGWRVRMFTEYDAAVQGLVE